MSAFLCMASCGEEEDHSITMKGMGFYLSLEYSFSLLVIRNIVLYIKKSKWKLNQLTKEVSFLSKD